MADTGYLTIGKVVAKLKNSYPDLTVSKVRYLQDEGLIAPSRTPGGYRHYSPKDVNRLETILYLQKVKFLPLSVIKEELDRAPKDDPEEAKRTAESNIMLALDDAKTVNSMHSIEKMPDLVGCSVRFVRELAEAGVIKLQVSKHGRTLVDGRDFALIRTCDELAHFGIGPKILRLYVTAANRESGMFEQALTIFGKKVGGVELEPTPEARARFNEAFTRMMALTDAIRDELISRQIHQTFKEIMQED